MNQNKSSNVQNKTHFVLRTRIFFFDDLLKIFVFTYYVFFGFFTDSLKKKSVIISTFEVNISITSIVSISVSRFFTIDHKKYIAEIVFCEILSINNSKGNFFFQMSVKKHDNIFIVQDVFKFYPFVLLLFLGNKLFLQIPRWSFCIAIRSFPILQTSFTNTHIHLLFLLSQRVAQLS